MPLWILSGKGAVQIMPFRKLGRKFHFFLRFCTRKRSKTYRYCRLFILCSLKHFLFQRDDDDMSDSTLTDSVLDDEGDAVMPSQRVCVDN